VTDYPPFIKPCVRFDEERMTIPSAYPALLDICANSKSFGAQSGAT
jgi:hypothetical protein